MLKDHFSDDQVLAAEGLIDIISPTSAMAHRHLSGFRAALQSEDEGDAHLDSILWAMKDVVDWESGYFVDWKDTDSFVRCATGIAEQWGATLTFGVADPLDDDFLSRHTVPDLLSRAHTELLTQGFMLWSWDTEGDCYAGWITRSTAAAAVVALSSRFGVRVLPGESSF